jgi:SAM-dependent methyltransferase
VSEGHRTGAGAGDAPPASSAAGVDAVRRYWDARIHDQEIARHPVGTRDFFDELEAYRFEKLAYLPRVVDFTAFAGRRLLEIGCGVGTDLVRFARHGAIVTGVDLSARAIELCRENCALHGVSADLSVMDGEHLELGDGAFDAVYAHGVVQYTGDPARMVAEIRRVLRPGGEAIVMVYNRYSWLGVLSRLFGVGLEHEDAPGFRIHSIAELRALLSGFAQVEIVPERFPVRTRLHSGWKAALYNTLFVDAFNMIPRRLVRPLGWHLIGKAVK